MSVSCLLVLVQEGKLVPLKGWCVWLRTDHVELNVAVRGKVPQISIIQRVKASISHKGSKCKVPHKESAGKARS